MRLKEDETYLCFGAPLGTVDRNDGVYRRDTRYLSTYKWDVGDTTGLLAACRENRFHQHEAVVGEDRGQAVSLERLLEMRADGFDDRWTVTNVSREPREVRMSLAVEGDFRDLFSTIGQSQLPRPAIGWEIERRTLRLSATTSDGIDLSVTIKASDGALFETLTLTLAPGESRVVSLAITLCAADDPVGRSALPSYAEWRKGFTLEVAHPGHRQALSRAIDDLRMLLFTTDHGAYPAAGMPWFVNVFGRDALITAMMLLEYQPQLAHDVITLLAAHQGRVNDAFREEEPGKILHEMRSGELSRTNRIPFGRYYGSVDSTALFVMAIGAWVDRAGTTADVERLRPSWEAAIEWLASHQASDGGLIAFTPSGSGLTVQSWKDSGDSMNHADGTAAEAPLSVAEVQGYTFAAFTHAADFYRRLGEPKRAADFAERARRLQSEFHQRFWLGELDTYAMALDRDGRPLAVLSSDPGHLLWTGIVPQDIAPRLVATLMGPALWSGWGLRTLGSAEQRYNPVSYHNGSVWPHDTALFGWGLARYGFDQELEVVATALFDLAIASDDDRLSELISGCARESGLPAVRYTHACRPQAWAAASLPLLAGLLERRKSAAPASAASGEGPP